VADTASCEIRVPLTKPSCVQRPQGRLRSHLRLVVWQLMQECVVRLRRFLRWSMSAPPMDGVAGPSKLMTEGYVVANGGGVNGMRRAVGEASRTRIDLQLPEQRPKYASGRPTPENGMVCFVLQEMTNNQGGSAQFPRDRGSGMNFFFWNDFHACAKRIALGRVFDRPRPSPSPGCSGINHYRICLTAHPRTHRSSAPHHARSQ